MIRNKIMSGLMTAAAVIAVCAAASIGGSAGGGSGALTAEPVAAVRVPVPVVTQGVRLYYLNSGGTLVPVYRVVAVRGGGVASAAVTALLQGPTAAERKAGISSAVPSGTVLKGITITNGTAVVDLTGRYASGGGSLSMTGRWAQLVWTVTQFPTVRRVSLRLDGHPVSVLGGEGVMIGRTATRTQWMMLPDIFIESPAYGQPVTSPVTVTGMSRYIFEAQFVVDVRNSAGLVLSRTRAWGTTGAFQPFTVPVRYSVTRTQPGSVVGFDFSAKNGKMIDVFTVAVTLRTTDLADGRYPVRITAVDAAHRTVTVRVVQSTASPASQPVRQLPVAATAVITVNTLTAAEGHRAVKNVRISLARLATLPSRSTSPFWITLREGQVTGIAQQNLR